MNGWSVWVYVMVLPWEASKWLEFRMWNMDMRDEIV